MPSRATCSCGHTFEAPSKYAGKKVKCPKCQQPVVLPGPQKAGAAAPTSHVKVTCACGKSFQAKAEWAGKRVKCPGCGAPVTVKAPAAGQPKQKKPASSTTKSNMDDLFDEIGFAPEEQGGPGRKCPECKAPMKREAIICIQCGYNENLGRRMEVERPVTATDRAKRAAKHTDATAGNRKAGGGQKLVLLAVVLVAVVAVVFVAKSQGWLPL